MVVVWHTKGSSYILAELDGAVSKTRFAVFCIVLYFAHMGDSAVSLHQLGMVDEGREDDRLDCVEGDADGRYDDRSASGGSEEEE